MPSLSIVYITEIMRVHDLSLPNGDDGGGVGGGNEGACRNWSEKNLIECVRERVTKFKQPFIISKSIMPKTIKVLFTSNNDMLHLRFFLPLSFVLCQKNNNLFPISTSVHLFSTLSLLDAIRRTSMITILRIFECKIEKAESRKGIVTKIRIIKCEIYRLMSHLIYVLYTTINPVVDLRYSNRFDLYAKSLGRDKVAA